MSFNPPFIFTLQIHSDKCVQLTEACFGGFDETNAELESLGYLLQAFGDLEVSTADHAAVVYLLYVVAHTDSLDPIHDAARLAIQYNAVQCNAIQYNLFQLSYMCQ